MSERGTNLWALLPVDPKHPDLAVLLRPHRSSLPAIAAAAQVIRDAGWRPLVATAGTVDELEALPPGTVVTDPDGHPWIRNRVGQWCEPHPAGIDPADLLADGPVTVHHIPADAHRHTPGGLRP